LLEKTVASNIRNGNIRTVTLTENNPVLSHLLRFLFIRFSSKKPPLSRWSLEFLFWNLLSWDFFLGIWNFLFGISLTASSSRSAIRAHIAGTVAHGYVAAVAAGRRVGAGAH
jgi:hypothetical protein